MLYFYKFEGVYGIRGRQVYQFRTTGYCLLTDTLFTS